MQDNTLNSNELVFMVRAMDRKSTPQSMLSDFMDSHWKELVRIHHLYARRIDTSLDDVRS